MVQLAETVVALEDSAETVERATKLLDKCGVSNAAVVQGDLKAVEHQNMGRLISFLSMEPLDMYRKHG